MIYLSVYGLVCATRRLDGADLLLIWFPSNKERYRTNKKLCHAADGLHLDFIPPSIEESFHYDLECTLPISLLAYILN